MYGSLRAMVCAATAALWFSVGAVPAGAQARTRPDPQVTRTSWGRVSGRVYEAGTGKPISGARVSIRHDGVFADTGKTAAQTDAAGQYTVQALLGRVSENFDLGRALESGIAGILLGGATNRTKRIDVTRLDARVVASGFRAYSGPVPCRSSDAAKFSVVMEPILLVPEGSTEVSAVADGWGAVRVLEVAVAPEVALHGSELTTTAFLKLPLEGGARGVVVVCSSPSLGKKRMAWVGSDPDGRARYEVKMRVPKLRDSVGEPVRVTIEQCPLDVAVGGASREAVVQLVGDSADIPLAEQRAAAERAETLRDHVTALERWQTACEHPRVSSDDYRRLAAIASRLGRHQVAMNALERAVEKAPDRSRTDVMGDHALALVRAGEATQVLSAYAPLVETRSGSARTRRTSLPLLVAVGESYVLTGQLPEAARILNELHEWPGPLPYEAIRFRNALRLAEATRRAETETDPAARVHLARVLMDLGRWEEGLAAAGSGTDGTMVSPSEGEIAYAMDRVLPRRPDDAADLDAAIRDAEAMAVIRDGAKTTKSRDFHTWHRYAMLLYRKAATVAAVDSERADNLRRCIEALEEAVRCGRAGARVNEGLYAGPIGYATARVVAVTGFAYPEAAWSYVLMESLRTLLVSPEDEYAMANLATALVELGQYRSAVPALDRLAAIRPDDPETPYLRAVIAMSSGDDGTARSHVLTTLLRNPRHPRANLLLARLRAREGDLAGAGAAMAAHQSIYGSVDDRARWEVSLP